MAKKIIDNTPIQNFEDDWGGTNQSGQEWGKTHSEVERVIKEKVADIEEELQDLTKLEQGTGYATNRTMSQKAITEQLNYVISLIPMIDVDEDGFFVVDENYNIGFGVTGSGVVGFKNVGYK